MRTDEKTGKEYTVYQVKCFPVDELATAPWVVSRRFSAFSDLREVLGSAIAKLPFPSRHMSMAMTMSLWGSSGKTSSHALHCRVRMLSIPLRCVALHRTAGYSQL